MKTVIDYWTCRDSHHKLIKKKLEEKTNNIVTVAYIGCYDNTG